LDCLSNTKKNGRKIDKALNYVGEKGCSEVNQASVECHDPSISTIPAQPMHQEYQHIQCNHIKITQTEKEREKEIGIYTSLTSVLMMTVL